MANIRDVARHAGVSVSTVSNVLNGRTDQMRQDTLAHIQRVMLELQFHPNRAAQQLKTGQARMIGLLVPSILNPSFAALAHEVDQAAKHQHDFLVLLGNTYRQEKEERDFMDDLLAHGIQGVIVASSAIDKAHFAAAMARGLVMVNYDCSTPIDAAAGRIPYDSISMDNMQAGRIATAYLIEQGCREIAFVTESSRSNSRANRINGFLATAAEAGLERHCRVIEGKAVNSYGDSEMAELGQRLAREIAQLPVKPDGIVAINDMLAMGLIAGFRHCNIRVPQDISVVGIDNIAVAGLINPPLTTVAPPLKAMAAMMVERLITRLNQPETPTGELLFEPTLVIRESVRAPARGYSPGPREK